MLCYAIIEAQAGKSFDASELLNSLEKIIDLSDATSLQQLGHKFDYLFNFSFEQPKFILAAFEGTDGSQESLQQSPTQQSDTQSITWWARFKESYVQVITEADTCEDTLLAAQSKELLNLYKSLLSKFSDTSWYDLTGGTSIKSHTSRVDKDQKGRTHYRNPKDGRFEKSPFDKSMDSSRNGGLNPTTIDGSLKFLDTKDYRVLDFLRSRAQGDNFNIETGGRLFFWRQKLA